MCRYVRNEMFANVSRFHCRMKDSTKSRRWASRGGQVGALERRMKETFPLNYTAAHEKFAQ